MQKCGKNKQTNKQTIEHVLPFSNIYINSTQKYRKGFIAIKQITAFYFNPYSKDLKWGRTKDLLS